MSRKRRRSLLGNALRLMARNYFEHRVGKNAAALAYQMLFAFFPLLMFISNLLGILDLNVKHVTDALENVLPKDIVGLIGAYLDHISVASSHILLWVSLIFLIWFPMQAVQGLMDDVRWAYGVTRPKKPVFYFARQLVYTLVFMLALGLTLVLSTVGEEVVSAIDRFLPEDSLRISGYFLRIWQYLRFLPIGLLMILAIGTLYAGSLDHRPKVRTVLPGLFAALISWLLVSAGFSFYVENFAHYSVLYGTLGAVVVLLIWLYMTALALILGAEFNAALEAARAAEEAEEAALSK